MIESSDLLRPYAAKCDVFPYGIDLDFWRSLDAEDIEEVGKMRRRWPRHIVAVGRFVSYKGFDVLVRSMRDVDGQATIVGDGPRHQEWKRLATKLGLANRVHLPGRLDRREVKRLFHSAQVFAFPSVNDAEAFGIVQLEAMAAGLPIVNTRLRTPATWVARHDQEALTVPPNDPIALANALNSILNQPDLAKRLGASASIRATEEFAQNVFQARMTTVYNDAIRVAGNSAERRHPSNTDF